MMTIRLYQFVGKRTNLTNHNPRERKLNADNDKPSRYVVQWRLIRCKSSAVSIYFDVVGCVVVVAMMEEQPRKLLSDSDGVQLSCVVCMWW